MFKKLIRLFTTIIHLRSKQIFYLLINRARYAFDNSNKLNIPTETDIKGFPLFLLPGLKAQTSIGNDWLTLLNLSVKTESIRNLWNDESRGKLWSYHLNYMDFLLQPGMDVSRGTELIHNYINELPTNHIGEKPYPASLRGINWIKFLSYNQLKDPKIDQVLYSHYKLISRFPEYHLMGNHLLENGFSLLFGAFYFKDGKLLKKACQILLTELEEQILADGAHFELSTMYHLIILERLLDVVNLLQNNNRFPEQEKLLNFFVAKARKMLIWLKDITFSCGETPLLNDSAYGFAHSAIELESYAIMLNVAENNYARTSPIRLSSSGYRKFCKGHYECIVDAGQVGPCYQSGHAHADTFSFVLYVNDLPVIIDQGVSTYAAGEDRLFERGTSAHNTVTVNYLNSSDVWDSFRMGRHAKVKILFEDENSVKAEHYGYRFNGTVHQREFQFSDHTFFIEDQLKGKLKKGIAHFWFSPRMLPVITDHTIELNLIKITFENTSGISLKKSMIPDGFNQKQETWKVEVTFSGQLRTRFFINSEST